MLYVIIALIVIGLLVYVGKHILFNPRVNSVISIIIFAAFMVYEPAFIIVTVIPIVDCIRDIVKAKEYYADDIEIEIDRLYMIKSLTAIPTLGLSRIVFLLIVGPLLSRSVSSDVKQKLSANNPLPHSLNYSELAARRYYYEKNINKLQNKGLLVSNIETVDAETKISYEKLSKKYPEKLIAKLVDKVAGNKDFKQQRERENNALKLAVNHMAYINSALFQRYAEEIPEVLAAKGTVSPHYIKNFPELSDLNLTIPCGDFRKSNNWSEYFIIQVLQPLVASGVIDDMQLSDETLNNHAYRHARSSVRMPSRNAKDIPALALDDDDDYDYDDYSIGSSVQILSRNANENPALVVDENDDDLEVSG